MAHLPGIGPENGVRGSWPDEYREALTSSLLAGSKVFLETGDLHPAPIACSLFLFL
jgi:hypothetical protein